MEEKRSFWSWVQTGATFGAGFWIPVMAIIFFALIGIAEIIASILG